MKNNTLFTLLLFLTGTALWAQPAEDTLSQVLNEVVISANKTPEMRKNVSQYIQVIDALQIRNANVSNTADVLSNTGAIVVQKSQLGGGSPILRGFEASRVLLVVDGVRLNNLIYRSGHLQNILTLDQNALSRVEVLYGPGSTTYGSDALGGVVHVFTRNPTLAAEPGDKLISGNAMFRYGSASNEKAANLLLNISGHKFGSLTNLSFSDFGDLRMGASKNPFYESNYGERSFYAIRNNDRDTTVANDNVYKQKQSAYHQYDILQKFIYRPSANVTHLLNLQFSNSSDVPRYDRLTEMSGTDMRFAEWYYGPQTRTLASYTFEVNTPGILDKLTAGISHQWVVESRHDRRFNAANRNDRIEKVNVAGLFVNMNKIIGKHNLRFGIDGQWSGVNSTASRFNVSTEAITPQNTRYPDGGNSMTNIAAYITDQLILNDQFTFNFGGRAGLSALRSTFSDTTFYPFPFSEVKQNNFTYSVSAGMIYNATEKTRVGLTFATGFRVPNVDDLSKIFDSTPGAVVVPNADIKPEKTLNADLSLRQQIGDWFVIEAVVFGTYFLDAIVTDKFTFNGQDSILYDGVMSGVMANQNKGKAYITGMNGTIGASLAAGLRFQAGVGYTYGRVINEKGEDTPLDHISPLTGRVGISYNKSRLNLDLYSLFNGWKHIEDYSTSGEDNAQYATADGMPAWFTLNLNAGFRLVDQLTVQAGIHNILDTQYRLFASGINAPGRNIFVTLRAQF